MQTLSEIRDLLERAGLRPQKQFGQNFLVDQNLMHKLIDLADLTGRETVLEVGPGTGALTEELLNHAKRVIAVEIDRGMAEMLRRHVGQRDSLLLLNADVLAGKHAINNEVLRALDETVHLVANLPYNIATPLLLQCLMESWHARKEGSSDGRRLFERMTFTIQRELADKLSAGVGGGDYGPATVIIALLGKTTPGALIPASAFWPRPKVASRIVRIDFDPSLADQLADIETLKTVLAVMFAQRRKQIASVLKRKNLPFDQAALADALTTANIKLTDRPQNVTPENFRSLANRLQRSANVK